MNREDAERLAPIMQAFADGEDIQYKGKSGLWKDINSPDFLATNEYRVKQPKKFGYLNIYRMNNVALFFDSKEEADNKAFFGLGERTECIRVEYENGQFDE